MTDAWTLKQAVVVALLFVGYFHFNLGRRGFGLGNTGLKTELGLTLAELGLISTLHSVAYGSSKFFGSLLTSFVPHRLLFGGALLVSALCNLAFGFGQSLGALAFFWTLNGLVQGFGWPALAEIIVSTFRPEHRGRVWSIASLSANISGTFAPALITTSIWYFDSWRAALFVPAALCSAVSLACLLGLPGPSDSDGSGGGGGGGGANSKQAVKSNAGWRAVVFSRTFWFLALSDASTYLVLRFFSEWWLLFATQVHHLDQISAASLLFWYEVGGVCGTLSFGIISDLVFKGRRLPTVVSLFAAVIPGTFFFLADTHFLSTSLRLSVALFLLSFGLCSAKSATGLIVSESFPHPPGFASGLFGIVGQLGNVAAGVPVGWLVDKHGWDSALTSVAASIFIGWALVAWPWLVQMQVQPEKKAE